MNPWHLSASDLLSFGIVLHLIADFPLQNDWMSNNKAKRRKRKKRVMGNMGEVDLILEGPWWDRHPAAIVHAWIHALCLGLIFGWAAIPLAVVHLIIDTRVPVVWWSKLIKQTQPKNQIFYQRSDIVSNEIYEIPIYDIGLEVRIWTDQVFHIACIAVAALVITL